MEKDIEKYLVKQVEQIGGKCYKWVSPGNSGVPDRIMLLPNEKIIFIETKTETGRLSVLQKVQHRFIRKLGFRVEVLNSKEKVDRLIKLVQEG